MKVAYLINQYPSVSHTFIRREINALERQDIEVERYAIRVPPQVTDSAADAAEEKRTRRILGGGKGPLIKSALATLLKSPGGTLSSLARALKMGAKSESGLVRHLFYWGEALVVADWLRRDKVHHIHAHFGTNSATVAMLAAPLADASYSITIHGPEEFDKPALIHLPDKIEGSAFVAGVSSYGSSQLRRLVPYELWDKIKVVHCGISRQYYAGVESKSYDNRTFVSVGRLSEQKGQATLIEAAGILKRAGHDFHIRLVGDGDLRAVLEKQIRAEGLEQYIMLVGWASPKKVKEEVLAARAFLLPSYAEGLPVSIMEALALKTPVITTYVAGIPELVKDGINGWLTPAADAAALAEAMQAALETDPTTLEMMGADGRSRITERHDVDREAEKLADYFGDALRSRGKAAQ
ncbi:glycosyltransferase family 4 protein [Parvularcula sp. LCG005]|uniref:glycosyltransferase family 4 protein n=1 Tax=Parvularcula sp. LCG005 TaxID=3078805 RepID=UPI002941FE15|nr:glycosyltransferase family 4 protein [Parvularcula sp. LCG005]WOI54516.1 glycosyltransferase family 4 protein [Parvularcula sp. LCG005]